jgi:hypothetical protein
MAIKVALGATENTHQEKSFPRVMKNRIHGFILFMTNYSEGIVLHSKDNQLLVGYLSKNWIWKDLVDYNDPITIQNN